MRSWPCQEGERDGEVDPNQLGAAPPGLATRPGPESEQVGQEGHQKHAARRAAPAQAMDDLGVVEWVDHGWREGAGLTAVVAAIIPSVAWYEEWFGREPLELYAHRDTTKRSAM